MQSLRSSLVHVTPVVNDTLSVEINDADLVTTDITYHITDARDQVLRKGKFRGISVHLRLAHLKDGAYQINISSTEKDSCSFMFKKISGSN
ncbi:MAG: hypothetical protein KIT80_14650 [Chitinophagaceae bacterium]|nr:hypothetical protein [Chitinophagaceae bacterium]MCW5928154.1 hypothetical protein [Chitinophagaceae bacterium]